MVIELLVILFVQVLLKRLKHVVYVIFCILDMC